MIASFLSLLTLNALGAFCSILCAFCSISELLCILSLTSAFFQRSPEQRVSGRFVLKTALISAICMMLPWYLIIIVSGAPRLGFIAVPAVFAICASKAFYGLHFTAVLFLDCIDGGDRIAEWYKGQSGLKYLSFIFKVASIIGVILVLPGYILLQNAMANYQQFLIDNPGF